MTVARLFGMDAKTARTLNIRAWVAAEQGPTAFAVRYGGDRWTAAQVSQWISETNPKPIGHNLARALEAAGGLPAGALDAPPESFESRRNGVEPAAHATRLNPDTVAYATAIIRHELRPSSLKFDPSGDIALFVVAYEYLADATLENRAAFETAVAEYITQRGGSNGSKTTAVGGA